MGRLVQLEQPRPLVELLRSLNSGLNHPTAYSLGLPHGFISETFPLIDRIATCAGSGASVFRALPARSHDEHGADLLVTGEMSHHEALAAIEKGKAGLYEMKTIN